MKSESFGLQDLERIGKHTLRDNKARHMKLTCLHVPRPQPRSSPAVLKSTPDGIRHKIVCCCAVSYIHVDRSKAFYMSKPHLPIVTHVIAQRSTTVSPDASTKVETVLGRRETLTTSSTRQGPREVAVNTISHLEKGRLIWQLICRYAHLQTLPTTIVGHSDR